MRVLLIGVGGVGEAIAVMSDRRPWLDEMVLADYDVRRCKKVRRRLSTRKRFPVEQLDASDKRAIVRLAKKHKVDLIVNAVAPHFNETIFDAAYAARCHYIDMAMTLSKPHPTEPYRQPGVMLGDYQFKRSSKWVERGLLALVGMGVEPGLSDIFARYAEKHLFDEIDEIGVRDGSNLRVRGYAFAPTFNVWTTIEECLNPPLIWDHERGWHTSEPFSEPEVFHFPDGIGPLEVVNVEHEEVVLIPRYINCRRVTFKYGLGDEFVGVLKMLHLLGLDKKEQVAVGKVFVAPRDVVVACLPNPALLGDKMTGKTCAGTWITGTKDGARRELYIYQVADNEECMRQYGVQAVVWQTAVNPVIAMDLLATGVWRGVGVCGPEYFDPDPFLAKMGEYDFPYGVREMKSPAAA
ncbi:MAG: saccharopine dehydrogenase NADP-binding domain-containing protein [Anaerolineales bacterium]|nr:saccharopine dehydrogenase NADP-binding domain-containing protein [Anaerolineales bacterium]